MCGQQPSCYPIGYQLNSRINCPRSSPCLPCRMKSIKENEGQYRKFYPVDIFEVIRDLMRRLNVVQRLCSNRKSRGELLATSPTHWFTTKLDGMCQIPSFIHAKRKYLIINHYPAPKAYELSADDYFVSVMKGLDHGVGHFRPLSITRHRHLLAYHGTAIAMKICVKYFDNFCYRKPLNSHHL